MRELVDRLLEPRRFIQIVAGSRQVGKTTLVEHAVRDSGLPARYASADEPTLRDAQWIEQQWGAARNLAAEAGERGALLVLDEVQKITGWSETVKHLWDADTRAGLPLKVVLLGSSPLLVRRGLGESLAGRFEMIPLPHWSFAEMRTAFGWSLEQYLFYGAYPGAAPLIRQPDRWARYVRDSLIEPIISRDILLLSRVDKPALLRRLLDLACAYSGRILSYNKMIGQLQDAGNTITLAHYLDLLAGAGLVVGLQKYAGDTARRSRIARSGVVWWNPRWARIWPTRRPPATARLTTGASATGKWTSSCGPATGWRLSKSRADGQLTRCLAWRRSRRRSGQRTSCSSAVTASI